MKRLALSIVLLIAACGTAGDQTAGATPNLLRVGLTTDVEVPTSTEAYATHPEGMFPIDWDVVLDQSGNPPATLVDGDILFVRDCWCEVMVHMDWRVPSQNKLRRLDLRLDNGEDFHPRIAAMGAGRGSGDGYMFTSTGPYFFNAGESIRTEVRQKSGQTTLFQTGHVTWLVVIER